MKKTLVFLALTILTLSSFAGHLWKGAGKELNATTTPQTYSLDSGDYTYGVSFHNKGSETLYVTLATSTNGFSTATAVPIAAGMTYTPSTSGLVNLQNRWQITAVTYATSNSTSAFNVTFQ